MDSSDLEKFSKTMKGISENFSAKLSEPGIDLMFESLKQYSFEQFHRAVMKILRNRKYTGTMPAVAEYIEVIEGNNSDIAELQCSQVILAIRECGRNNIPNFKNLITKNIVTNHYGWENICNKSQSELPFFEKEFKAKYIAHSNINSSTQIQAPERLKKLTENIGGT